MKLVDIIQLVSIYIILTTISYAFYLVFIAVNADDAVASSLLSWSATMFATVALLYTFNRWRDQKGSDVLSSISIDLYKNLEEFNKIYYEYIESHIDNLNKPEGINVFYGDEKRLNPILNKSYLAIIFNIDLICAKTKDSSLELNEQKFQDEFIKLDETIRKTLNKAVLSKDKMPFSENGEDCSDNENKNHYIIDVRINRDIVEKYINDIKNELLKYIFHDDYSIPKR